MCVIVLGTKTSVRVLCTNCVCVCIMYETCVRVEITCGCLFINHVCVVFTLCIGFVLSKICVFVFVLCINRVLIVLCLTHMCVCHV